MKTTSSMVLNAGGTRKGLAPLVGSGTAPRGGLTFESGGPRNRGLGDKGKAFGLMNRPIRRSPMPGRLALEPVKAVQSV